MTITSGDYEVFDNVSSTDKTWAQWRAIVESEGWKSDDHSVMELTPILSSTRSVVAKDKEGNFVGSVVWNEYDSVAFIGFYLLREEHRGKGIGSVIWKRALGRMPQNYTVGLRSVPYMASRYQSKDTPIEGPKLNEYNVSWKVIHDICVEHENKEALVKSVKTLTAEEQVKFEEFDRKITGKDRSDFLRKFFALPFTAGNVLFDKNGEIVASAAITSTSTQESHMFKLAPIYADSLTDALTVSRSLINFAFEQDKEARILFHILSGTRGEKELLPLLTLLNVDTRLTGVTLFSKEIVNPIDTDKVYIAHNNSGHYDA